MRGIIISFSLLLFSVAALAQTKQHKNIRFEFTVTDEKYPNTAELLGKKMLEVKCQLVNPYPDTVYLLAYSCNKVLEFLIIDDILWNYTRMYCFREFPYTEIIPPKGNLEFTEYLQQMKDTSTLKLGFSMYELDRFYNIDDREDTNKLENGLRHGFIVPKTIFLKGIARTF